MAKKAKKAAKKPAKKTVKKAAKKAVKKSAPKKAAKKATKKSLPLPAGKAGKKAAKKSAPKKVAKKAAKKPAPKKAAKKVVKVAVPKPEPKRTSISPYINFDGNCEEAFNFYKSVFGGEFGYVGRFNEMPPQEGQPPLPEEFGKRIMHISLPFGKDIALMGSDVLEGFGPPMVAGTNFAVSINAVSDAEADRLYKGLSEGGDASMPMAKQFWGTYFGMLTDKFGINWMISSEPEKK